MGGEGWDGMGGIMGKGKGEIKRRGGREKGKRKYMDYGE